MTEGGVKQDKRGQTLTKQHLKKTDSKQSTLTAASDGDDRERESGKKTIHHWMKKAKLEP